MMNIFLIFLISFFSFISNPVQEAKINILAFGNSITAGYGIDPSKAYPAVLEDILNENKNKYRVINAGLSGETSAGGLNRIDWVLRQPVDIFILELGGNDGLRGLPLEQTKKNLQSILEKVKSKYPSAKLVIAGMKVPPNMGERYGNEFEKMYPELAEKNNAILIPFLLEEVGGNPELNLPDGIHPTPQGHKIIAETLYQAIEDIL